ncbi:MAG: response regulator [Lachnospiraceae bacterium]|nr:response regulator [Lachnospiraceae bacterium]
MYNFSYELLSVFVLATVYFALRLKYGRDEMIENYMTFVRVLFAATALDVITAIILNYYPNFPHWLNTGLNTALFFYQVYCGYAFCRYVENVIENRSESKRMLNRKVNLIILIVSTVFIFSTPYTKWIFYFDENGRYMHGPFFLVTFIPMILFVLNGIRLLAQNHKQFKKQAIVALVIFVSLEFIVILLQRFLYPDVLIGYCTATLLTLFLWFTIDTPDYLQLMSMMDQLQEARDEADAANLAKSAFLTNMSHEIRTPINGVLGMNAMILKECRDPQIVEYSKNIESAGRSLLALVNDVLDISKVESGKMEIVESEYRLGKLLTDCQNMVVTRVKEKGLELKITNDPELPAILYGDEVRIRQIISNLLTNAVKYTRNGSINVDVSQKDAEGGKITLVVRVADTGIGIRPENLEKIFDAFQRVDLKENRSIEGTGMGLRIARQLTIRMGGILRAESEYGTGSVFTLELPQAVRGKEKMGDFKDYKDTIQLERSVTASAFTAPTARILVVDDIPMNLKVMQGLLKETKIQVDLAESGMECLEKVQRNLYDIVFLDHLMPEIDGIETLNRIHKMENCINQDIPMIMLTANAVSGAREQYLWAGFTEYLAKPVRENDLCKILIRYLPKDKILWNYEPTESRDEVAYENMVAAGGAPRITDVDVPSPQQGRDAQPSAAESISEGAVTDLQPGIIPRQTGSALFASNIPESAPDAEDKEDKNVSDLEARFPSLNIQVGLEYCGDMEDFYLEMIQEFLKPDYKSQMIRAKEEKDWSGYQVHAHSLKSSARTIGAEEFARKALGLEQAGANKDEAYIEENQEKVFAALDTLMEELRKGLEMV